MEIANLRTPITILSDSQKALRAIALLFTLQDNQFLRGQIYKMREKLQWTEHLITFQWIPSHSKISGNEKADLTAKNRAEKEGKLTMRQSLLGYIRKNVKKIRSKDIVYLDETEVCERKTSRRGYYIPQIRESISIILEKAPKKYVTQFYQLKVGQKVVKNYLAKIRVIEIPQYWWCGQAKQSVEHFYTKCQWQKKERQKLLRTLYKKVICWWGETKNKGLAFLLTKLLNEKTIDSFLDFLKSTKLSERKGAREKELKQQQKSDCAGEKLHER